MKTPEECKKIEETELEYSDGGMSTDEALKITGAVIALGVAAVGVMKLTSGGGAGGQQAATPVRPATVRVEDLPQDLNQAFIARGPISFD